MSTPRSDGCVETAAKVSILDSVARLLQRSREGDKDAFGQIFRLHRDSIRRLVTLHLGADIDDVVAEVFTRAWICLPRYQASVPFAAWLLDIARETVTTERPRRALIDARTEVAEALAKWATSDRGALAEAFAKLAPEHQRLIEMRFFMGMNTAEVAAAMEVDGDTVSVEQWRALSALRDELERAR